MFIITVILLFAGFCLFQVAYIKFSGSPVLRPDIARKEQTTGVGPDLKYAILGDSTAVSQGGDYQQGFAVASAEYLAKNYTVHWKNLAVPGARAADIVQEQVPAAVSFNPDIVLISVGANDVTHLTKIGSVADHLVAAVVALRAANPSIKIILTGAPDMGSIPRFAQPVRWLAGIQTERLNEKITELAAQEQLVLAPIAKETGPEFRAHPELFAADQFHPTSEGYKIWIPVILRAIDQVFRR